MSRKIVIQDDQLSFGNHSESESYAEGLGITEEQFYEFGNNINNDIKTCLEDCPTGLRSELVEELDKNFSRAELLIMCENFIFDRILSFTKDQLNNKSKDSNIFGTFLKDILDN